MLSRQARQVNVLMLSVGLAFATGSPEPLPIVSRLSFCKFPRIPTASFVHLVYTFACCTSCRLYQWLYRSPATNGFLKFRLRIVADRCIGTQPRRNLRLAL